MLHSRSKTEIRAFTKYGPEPEKANKEVAGNLTLPPKVSGNVTSPYEAPAPKPPRNCALSKCQPSPQCLISFAVRCSALLFFGLFRSFLPFLNTFHCFLAV